MGWFSAVTHAVKKVGKAAIHPVSAVAKDVGHVAKGELKIVGSLAKVRNLNPLNLTKAIVRAGIDEGKLAAGQVKFAAQLARSTSPLSLLKSAPKKKAVTQFRGQAATRVAAALSPPKPQFQITPGTTPSAMADALRTAATMQAQIADGGTGSATSIVNTAQQDGAAQAASMMNPGGSAAAFTNSASFASQSFSSDDYDDSGLDPAEPATAPTVQPASRDTSGVVTALQNAADAYNASDDTSADNSGDTAGDDVLPMSSGTASDSDDVLPMSSDTASDSDDVLPMSSGTASDSDDVLPVSSDSASDSDDVLPMSGLAGVTYDMTPHYLPPGQRHRELGNDDDDSFQFGEKGLGSMTGYAQYMSHLNGAGLGSFWDTIEGDVSQAASSDFAKSLEKNLAVTALNTTANAIGGHVKMAAKKFQPHPPMAMGTKLIIAAAVGVPLLLVLTHKKG